MLTVILIMSSGMFLGYFFRKKEKLVKFSEPVITVSIFALLFLLGVSVGTNETILENLDMIGVKAVALTLGGVAGSVILSFFVYRSYFRNEK